MTHLPPGIFPGPVKTKILKALADAEGPVYAADLCEVVFGNREQPKRDVLRNLVAQMRPKLAKHGLAIYGRKELRMNAYVLVNTLLD